MNRIIVPLFFLLVAVQVCAADPNPVDYPQGCPPNGNGAVAGMAPNSLKITEGPDAIVEGSQYTAVGGNGDYTWSISPACGIIDPISGYVSDMPTSCCGSAKVIVSDENQLTDTREVQMPGGRWVQDSHEELSTNYYNSSGSYYFSDYTYYGGYRTHSVMKFVSTSYYPNADCSWRPSFPVKTEAKWTVGVGSTAVVPPAPALCDTIYHSGSFGYNYRFIINTAWRYKLVCQ